MPVDLKSVPDLLTQRLRRGEHSELEFRQLALQMQGNGGVHISDQHWRGIRYERCFVASALVTWLTDALFVPRHDAVKFARQMQHLGLIWHVTDNARAVADEISFFRVLPPAIINRLLLPSELWTLVVEMQSRNGPVPRPNTYLGQQFQRCFPGSEVVTWLVTQKHAVNRRAAILIGQQLSRCGLLEHVTRMHGFHDNDLLFQYYCDFVDYSQLEAAEVQAVLDELGSPGDGTTEVLHEALLGVLKRRKYDPVRAPNMTLQLQILGLLEPYEPLGIISEESAHAPGYQCAPKHTYTLCDAQEAEAIVARVERDRPRLNRPRPMQILGQLEAPRSSFDRATWLRRALFSALILVLIVKATYLSPSAYHTFDHVTRNVFGQTFDQFGFNIEMERVGVQSWRDVGDFVPQATATLAGMGASGSLVSVFPLRVDVVNSPGRPCHDVDLAAAALTCYYPLGDERAHAAEQRETVLVANRSVDVGAALAPLLGPATRRLSVASVFVSGTGSLALTYAFTLELAPDGSILVDIDPNVLPLAAPAPLAVDVLLWLLCGWFLVEIAATAYMAGSRFLDRRTNILSVAALAMLLGDAVLQARLLSLVDEERLRAMIRDTDSFVDLSEAEGVLQWQIGCVTSALFFCFFSLLKYLETNAQISTILISLRRASGPLSGAGAVLLALVAGFVMVFYCLMSNASSRYQTITQSSLTMLNFLIGKLDLRYFYLHHTVLGSLVAIAYVIILKLCLLNVIVSQVFTTYNSVAADYRDASTKRDAQSYESRRRRSLKEYATANFVVIVDVHNKGYAFDVVDYNNAQRLYAEHHDSLLELEIEDRRAKGLDLRDGIFNWVVERRDTSASVSTITSGRSRTVSEDEAARRLDMPGIEDLLATEDFTVAPRFMSSRKSPESSPVDV